MTQGATPSWSEAIRLTVQRFTLALHTAMPGRVISYDPTTQTADVQPLLKWASHLPGQLRKMFDLPPLPNVLVCHTGSASIGMHVPVQPGDLCLLVFCSRSLAAWRSASDPTRVTDPGKVMDPTPLDGAVAIPLMHHDSRAWSTLSAGQTVNIGSDTGIRDFVAKAELVEAQLEFLKSAIENAVIGVSDSGLAFKNALILSLANWPLSVAADDVTVT